MNVKIITNEPMPNGKAATSRIKLYALGLSDNGTICDIVVTRRTEIKNQDRNNNNNCGHIYSNVNYTYLTKDNRQKSILRYYFDKITEPFITFAYCLKHNNRETIILYYGNRIILEIVIWISAIITKSKLCRELGKYPYLKNGNKTIKSWISITFIFKIYDAFICISEELNNIAQTHKNKHSKTINIPILVKTDRNNYKPDIKHLYIFHSGGLSEIKDGFCNILESFALTRNAIQNDIHLYICSKWDKVEDKDYAQKIIDKYEIRKNIHFLGYIKEDDVVKYQNGSLLFWLPIPDNLTNRCCFPTKLGEYLSSGNPIIISDVGEQAKYLCNGDNAFIVHTCTSKEMADLAIKIINNPKEAMAVGAKGKKTAIENFDYKINGKILFNFFQDLIDTKNTHDSQ